MALRLPIKLRKTDGGYVIECGADSRATLFIYVQNDSRVDSRFMPDAEAREFATEVARGLRQSWVIRTKHGG